MSTPEDIEHLKKIMTQIGMTQKNIDDIDLLISEAMQENKALVSTLTLYKEIIEKKDFEYMTMSSRDRENAKFMKSKKGAS